MDCFTQSPSFTLPLYSPEYNRNVQEYEKTAEKALRNITSIYNEIMAPKSYDLEDLETDNAYNEENISQSCAVQNHYVRTCCNSVKELCVRCDRFISRCKSCNHCKCYAAGNNRVQRNSCNGSSSDYHSSNIQHFDVKCTVPKPFSFCSKIEEYRKAKENKISKLKQDRETKIESELKVRPNFKPVPKSTHLNLYGQMAQQKEQRKAQRREECQEKLNNTKPFNLLSSSRNYVKAKSTTDLNSENAQFRAKPVPKHILSDRVSEKLKNKEEIRKLLNGERAKQTIEKSSLPFSQRTVPCTRSCVDLCGLNKTQNKEAKPRDISEITKRLYVKKCSETMENWNKRVLQVNTNKENQKMYNPLNEYMSLDIKQLTKKEELPFVYFPVRMSSASLLREKQIR